MMNVSTALCISVCSYPFSSTACLSDNCLVCLNLKGVILISSCERFSINLLTLAVLLTHSLLHDL